MGIYSDPVPVVDDPSAIPGAPILINRPAAIRSLSRKFTGDYTAAQLRDGSVGYPQLEAAGVDPAVLNALAELDLRNVERGQLPMSGRQTLNAIRAAPSPANPYGTSVQPQESRRSLIDIPGNVVSDLRAIFTSIPKIPVLLFQQVKELPTAPARLAEVMASGEYEDLGTVPGLGLIPGVYTLGNILGGDFGEMIEHPLFTALDVTPYAKARIFNAPASMLDNAGNIVRRPNAYSRTFSSTRAPTLREEARLAGRNVFGQTGKVSAAEIVANTKLGRAIGQRKDLMKLRLRGTNAGEAVMAAIGDRNVRFYMAQVQQAQRAVLDMLDNPNSPFWKLDPKVRNRIFGKAFEMDKPFLDEFHAFERKWGDDFGKAEYGSVDAWKRRRIEIGQLISRDTRHIPDIKPLTPLEESFVADYARVRDMLIEPYVSTSLDTKRPFVRVDIETPAGNVTSEIYTWAEGSDILAKREALAAHAEVRDLHQFIAKRSGPLVNYTPEQIQELAFNSRVLNGQFSAKLKSELLEGYAHALMLKGVDSSDLLSRVISARYGGGHPDLIDRAVNLSRETIVVPPYTLDDLDAALRPRTPSAHTRSGFRRGRIQYIPEIHRLDSALDSGNIPTIRREINRIWRALDSGRLNPDDLPPSFHELDRAGVRQSLSIYDRAQKWTRKNEVAQMASSKRYNKTKRALADKEKRTTPARFEPHIADLVHEQMVGTAQILNDLFAADPAVGADLLADMVRRVEGRDYAVMDKYLSRLGKDAPAPSAADLFAKFRREAMDSWQDLVDAGFNPQFIHKVDPHAISPHFPGIRLGARAPESWHERTFDLSAGEGDIALALRADGMQYLRKKMEDHLIDVITKGSLEEGWLPLAKTRAELLDDYAELIDREVARRPGATPRDRDVIADELIGKAWTVFDAPKYKNFPIADDAAVYGSGARTAPRRTPGPGQTQTLYIPRSMHRAMLKMQEAPKAHAVLDPAMHVFRLSTLVLSPRWQIYNLLGNLLMGSMSAGKDFWVKLPEAVRMLRRVRAGEESSMPFGLRTSLAQAGDQLVEPARLAKEGVQMWGEALDRIRPGTSAQISNWGKPLARGGARVQDFLVRMNAAVDDATRIAMYLAERERALVKLTGPDGDAIRANLRKLISEVDPVQGSRMSTADNIASNQAETMIREWVYNWDQLTPWERSVGRHIFPFYGFFSHILRYAKRYAADHPFRTAVTAGFARAELEDWGTGLPQRIHNMLIIGKEDEEGDRLALNFSGWNPFVDTANLFSLTGWLSQVNPFIATIAQQLGIDPRTGQAGVYPATEFDPVTGRLTIKKPNILSSFVNNMIPQTQALGIVFGSPEMDDLRRNNPEAAGRLLLSSLGIPVLYRDVNLTQEIAQTELARENAARQAFSEALRSNSTQPVRRYPALVAQVQQLQRLQAERPEAFAPYTPTVQPAGVLDITRRVVAPWVGDEVVDEYAGQASMVASTPGWG